MSFKLITKINGKHIDVISFTKERLLSDIQSFDRLFATNVVKRATNGDKTR